MIRFERRISPTNIIKSITAIIKIYQQLVLVRCISICMNNYFQLITERAYNRNVKRKLKSATSTNYITRFTLP